MRILTQIPAPRTRSGVREIGDKPLNSLDTGFHAAHRLKASAARAGIDGLNTRLSSSILATSRIHEKNAIKIKQAFTPLSHLYRILLILITSCLITALHDHGAFAGGIFHFIPPKTELRVPIARPVVLLSHTLVTVSESEAEFRFDQTFYNDNDYELEGLYVLPIDKMLATDIEAQIDGHPAGFQVLSAHDFLPDLKRVITASGDPSLLEIFGSDMLVIKPLNIGVKGQKALKIRYKTPLRLQNDLMDLKISLAGERYSVGPIGEFETRVRFKPIKQIRSIFSPTHHFETIRESGSRLTVKIKSEAKRIKEDFRLITTFGGSDLDVKAFAHKTPGGEGTFMLLVSPPVTTTPDIDHEKEVIFILDRSGSMGPDLTNAKEILGRAFESLLRAGDRFGVVAGGTKISMFSDKLLPADEENVLNAWKFVNSFSNHGGTDLYNALIGSLERFSPKRKNPILIYVGDGRATVGITNRETIINDVNKFNRAKAKIYGVVLGANADIALIDKIAAGTKGASLHLSPGPDKPDQIIEFFRSIAAPLMSEITTEISDIAPNSMEPDPIPDLSAEDTLVLFGKYNSSNPQARVGFKAKINGRNKIFNTTITLPEVESAHSYVPALWAMRRLGRTLDKVLIKGADDESNFRIRRLADEFGFRAHLSAEHGHVWGPDRQKLSKLVWDLKNSNVLSDIDTEGTRSIGGKRFYYKDGRWVDRDYTESLPLKKYIFCSEEYFAFVEKHSDLSAIFALGTDILFVHDAAAVEIVSTRDDRKSH